MMNQMPIINLRKRKRLLVIVAIIALFVVAACGDGSGGAASVSSGSDSDNAPIVPLEVQQLSDTNVVAARESGLPALGDPVQETPIGERIVIKNATLELQVDDAGEIGAAISSLAESMGGWVVNSNISSFEGRSARVSTQGSITIRVPADQFDDALDQIKALGLRVRSEIISGEDVTAEFVDLSSQLENLRASEDQLRQIMDSASDVEDVLNVRAELERVLGEINVIEGRLRFFRESAAFSSITVQLIREASDEAEIENDGWSPGDTIDEAFGALADVARVSTDVLIWLVIVLLPIALVAGVIAYAGWRTIDFVLRRISNQQEN